MAIAYVGIPVEIREVQLKNKPEQMLSISPKGTVPVLQLPDGEVLDESLDIMRWALAQNDPDNWLYTGEDAGKLIEWNDGEFKYYLDRYKYADRYPAFPAHHYRSQAEKYLLELESRLVRDSYLANNHFSLLDVAVFPFIRQFSLVDPGWFVASGYSCLILWLNKLLDSSLFASVMTKNPVWQGTGYVSPPNK